MPINTCQSNRVIKPIFYGGWLIKEYFIILTLWDMVDKTMKFLKYCPIF